MERAEGDEGSTAIDEKRPQPLIFHNLPLSNLVGGQPVSAGGAALPWEPFRPGVEIARLYSIPGAHTAALLRYAPGAKLDRHYHVGFEHIFVLSGSQVDDNGEHPAGTLLVHPPGTSHAITAQTGCIVLALWEKPVVFPGTATDRDAVDPAEDPPPGRLGARR